MEIWAFAVLFAAGAAALVRRTGLADRAGLPFRRGEPGRLERFWSRRNGRVLAVAWSALFAAAWLAPFAAGLGDNDFLARVHPIRFAVLLGVQAVAAVLLVPMTAGLYLYKRAVPQIARDEADERERLVQGDVYWRTHMVIIVGLAVGGAMLVLFPGVGHYVVSAAGGFGGVLQADRLLPAWVLLFMLPSVIYAWTFPRRDDVVDAHSSRSRLGRAPGRGEVR